MDRGVKISFGVQRRIVDRRCRDELWTGTEVGCDGRCEVDPWTKVAEMSCGKREQR